MTKFIVAICTMVLSISTFGQDISGHWATFGDDHSESVALIEIVKESDVYSGYVVAMYRDADTTRCYECPGERYGQPILGMTIVKHMKQHRDSWKGGLILDPESGSEYKCQMTLIDAHTLEVRGYIGMPIFGRSQIWRRRTYNPSTR